MMSGHGASPIFCNKKNKNRTFRTLATPLPPTSSNISFLPYPPPPRTPFPIKLDVICVSPLNWNVKTKIKILFHTRVLTFLQVWPNAEDPIYLQINKKQEVFWVSSLIRYKEHIKNVCSIRSYLAAIVHAKFWGK